MLGPRRKTPGAAALSNPRGPVTETLLLLPSASPGGRGEARRGLPPAHLTLHTLAIAHRPGHPEALFKPGQEDCVPRLCSSVPRANRGSARKGSRSHAFGSHWINATAVLEGSSGRALESPGTGLDPRAPARAPCASASTSVDVCVMRAHCSTPPVMTALSLLTRATPLPRVCEAGFLSACPGPAHPRAHPASLAPRHRGRC